MSSEVPTCEIRAQFDSSTIRLYQAYSDEIADAALAAQTFVPPFKKGRMTWIKPSFLWMMYRSGWATKLGQARILAVDIVRTGFEWALDHACLARLGEAVKRYTEDWIRHIEDVTQLARDAFRASSSGNAAAVSTLLPRELPYSVSVETGKRIGIRSP